MTNEEIEKLTDGYMDIIKDRNPRFGFDHIESTKDEGFQYLKEQIEEAIDYLSSECIDFIHLNAEGLNFAGIQKFFIDVVNDALEKVSRKAILDVLTDCNNGDYDESVERTEEFLNQCKKEVAMNSLFEESTIRSFGKDEKGLFQLGLDDEEWSETINELIEGRNDGWGF